MTVTVTVTVTFRADTLPNGRIIYRMVLTYKFTPAESGKHKITVPGLNTHIYDNAIESQMYMVS